MSHILAVVQRGKEHDFPGRNMTFRGDQPSGFRDVHANVHHGGRATTASSYKTRSSPG